MAPDRRRHRGPHPRDEELFADQVESTLRRATADLSWLLSKGYALTSSLKLVGDRYDLRERQRVAIGRAACSDEDADKRHNRRVDPVEISADLVIDGFNLIVTVEAALSGGVLLQCRDGAIRDLASVHGSYRKVEETVAAVYRIAEALDRLATGRITWLLDRPVSNSGRLAGILREVGREVGADWEVDVADEVDSRLVEAESPVVSSDSHVLDGARAWLNLAEAVVETLEPRPWIVDLRPES